MRSQTKTSSFHLTSAASWKTSSEETQIPLDLTAASVKTEDTKAQDSYQVDRFPFQVNPSVHDKWNLYFRIVPPCLRLVPLSWMTNHLCHRQRRNLNLELRILQSPGHSQSKHKISHSCHPYGHPEENVAFAVSLDTEGTNVRSGLNIICLIKKLIFWVWCIMYKLF